MVFLFFFFNDTATTEIYTLSLHDALPICNLASSFDEKAMNEAIDDFAKEAERIEKARQDAVKSSEREKLRSEEHTSELQSQSNLVCRLLLEKKKKKKNTKQSS